MTELSPRAQELMRRASRGGGPTERQRRSLKSAVMAAVMVPAVAGALTLKLVVVGFVVAAVSAGLTVGAVAALHRAPAPAAKPTPDVRAQPTPPGQVVPVAPAPEVLVLADPEVVVRAEPAPEGPPGGDPPPPPRVAIAAPRAAVTPAIEAPSSTPSPPSVSVNGRAGLAREMEMLDRAVRAVESERFDDGLSEAREFLRHFPGSELVIEARVVEVLALCGLSRPEEARATAASLPTAAAGNPAMRRLENSCVESSPP